MRLCRALLFLLLVSLTFPSGHCCREHCTRATVVAVGTVVASSIITGIATNWEKFHTYFEKQINNFSWIASGWFAGKAKQKPVTQGNFPPVKLVLAPPQHKSITRSEELTELKELFDSFDTSTDDKAVYAVHLVGLPGSGKSELARQYGNLVFKSGEVSTVITLNTESEKQFRDDLIEALLELKAAKGNNYIKRTEEYSEEAMEELMFELQLLLRDRPGWLLIVDNHSTTQRSFYKELPVPGTHRWGQGYVLLTTQVLVREAEDKFVKIKSINKMTTNDAKQFLCELVRRGKGDCPDGDAEAIVKRLDYLPLTILAAGTVISERKMEFQSYTLAEYLENYDEENTKDFKTDYQHSMRTALLLAVRNSVEGDSANASIVRDFCAFVGFTDVEEIHSLLVEGYVEMKNYSEGSIQQLIDFPLVNFLEEKKVFRVHQVMRHVFRAELIQRSTRQSGKGDLLLESFRNISHFFFTVYDEKKMGYWEARSYFRYVLSHHSYSLNDIISPDENLEVAASVIFRLVDFTLFGHVNRCSELQHFVARLLSAPENTTNTSYIRFTGYRLVYYCLRQNNQAELSEEFAVKGAEIIKELVPESPEVHAMPFFKGYGIDVLSGIKSVEPTDKKDNLIGCVCNF